MNWANGQGYSGTYERCGIASCLRAAGHAGLCRLPKFPTLGPGRCQGCKATVWYGPSKAGWRRTWRDEDGRKHRCAVAA